MILSESAHLLHLFALTKLGKLLHSSDINLMTNTYNDNHIKKYRPWPLWPLQFLRHFIQLLPSRSLISTF